MATNPFTTRLVLETDYAKKPKGPGVIDGGRIVAVPGGNPDGSRAYYVVYPMPPGQNQHFASYKFDDFAQVKSTFGGDPNDYKAWLWTKKQFDKLAPAVGSAAEIVGMAGDWNHMSQGIMREAAEQAGIRDPSLVGKIWSNPEMQRIAADAVIGDWTDEQVRAEQRKTKFWQDVLYPGIKRFYGATAEPEKAWVDYSTNVEGGLLALGTARDADGTYNTQIKRMLDKGLDDQVFMASVPIFQQAKENDKYRQVLSQWSQRELGRPVTFADWYGLQAGDTLPELQGLAERASIAYQSQQASAGLSNAQVERLATETNMSEQQAAALFGEFNRSLIALGDQGLKRGNLSRDEILSAAAGIEPTSGRSIEEVRLLAAKLAQENDLFDEEKINFYTGYSPAGTPMKPGLAALRPEGA